MRSSIELREPFLDHRLVELAMRQPPERKIADGVRKWLLRQIAASTDARTTWWGRSKRPVQTPQREWLRGPLRDWAASQIDEALAWHVDWLDRDAVRRQWAAYCAGEADNSFYVWQWISLGLIHEVRGVLMRIGVSDTKNVTTAAEIRRHRVILPIYIPRLSGYFTDAIKILGMCLESLRLTAADKVSVTLIANQCADTVMERLNGYFADGWIDQLVINNENRGRIDAVVSAASGAYEPLLTLSDSDVIFKAGWLDAIENLLATFPECGMASIVPHPGTAWHHTSATVLDALSKGELSMAKVVSDEDIDRFGVQHRRAGRGSSPSSATRS